MATTAAEELLARLPSFVSEMIDVIVATADPTRIFIFGSMARGDDRRDSDIDFLIVVREPFGPGRSRRKLMAEIAKKLMFFPIAKDILLFSEDEIEEWRDCRNHVIGRAMSEGVEVYDRA